MRRYAKNMKSQEVLTLLSKMQSHFRDELTKVSLLKGEGSVFVPVEWLRDNGEHGGGVRFESRTPFFNRASINVSQIHYEEDETKQYDSATALSTIIHPAHPLTPSIHMHFSWTQLKDGTGYWRIMSDLNPSHIDDGDKMYFDQTLKVAAKSYFTEGRQLGNAYFDIPALKKKRGVSHFYLERFIPQEENDITFVTQFMEKVIKTYIDIISLHTLNNVAPTEEQRMIQLNYHTLYFYQVLTLDKGTTAGLLVHDQNDVGTLGSIPSHINRDLLEHWQTLSPIPMNVLVSLLLDALPKAPICEITTSIKKALAVAIREFHHPL